MNYDFSGLPFARVSSRYWDRKFPLHVLTNLSGRSRETSGKYYNDGKRANAASYTVMQYTTGGRGCIKANGKLTDITPDTMMIVNVPGEEVYYLPETSGHWEFVFITMAGRESRRIVRAVQNIRGNVIEAEKIPKTMELFHGLVNDLFSQSITNPFSNSSYSYRLCMALLEESEETGTGGEPGSLEELLIMLHNNMHRDIPIDEMAGFMRLSRSHFTRLFARNVGTSPRKYLEELRLKAAASLLMNEEVNIKEAASRVGIRDENYFCRVFRNHYGISPGKLRKRGYWER